MARTGITTAWDTIVDRAAVARPSLTNRESLEDECC